jgi:fluoride exporter
MIKFVYLALGGASGAILRYLISGLPYKIYSGVFPWGTLVVNLSGALLIGFFWGLLGRENTPVNVRSFLFIGLFGSFTTFSTFAFENFNLIRDGNIKFALINIVASNVFGILLVFAGFILSKIVLNIKL